MTMTRPLRREATGDGDEVTKVTDSLVLLVNTVKGERKT